MALLTDDSDLSLAWRQACDSFAETTGIELSFTSPPSPDQILAKFDEKKAKDEKARAKIEKAKAIVGKTLTCVVQVGGVVAQAASMVFGPAAICMNAISFFVEAGINYGNIFRGLDELFSRIFRVLERIQVYLDNKSHISKPMIRIASGLLLSFIRICELSCKVLQGNKPLKFLKVAAFNDDDDVREELRKLDRLEADESQMKGTLGLVSAKITEKNVVANLDITSKTYESIRKSEKEGEVKKQKKQLENLLGVSSEDQKKSYRSSLESLITGTGEWLNNETSYQKWSDAQDEEHIVLFFHGNEGYGKTSIMSHVVRELLTSYPQGREVATQVSVAYCYLKKKTQQNSPSVEKPNSLGRVLKILAHQVGLNDPIYRKNIINSMQDHRLEDIKSLWETLFLNHSRQEATLFLLIDGLQELEYEFESELVQLLKDFTACQRQHSSLRIKVLLTGRVQFIQKLAFKIGCSEAVVDLAIKTKPDILKYVKHRLKDMEIFNTKSSEVQDLKEEVCQGLVESVKGDYIHADLLLKSIKTMQRPSEIRALITKAKAGGQRSDSISAEIERCNQVLSDEEIEDLNVLLLWVIHALRPLTLAELRGILNEHRGESSLRPLFNQIKDRYSAFFFISPDRDQPSACVFLLSDSIADYFLTASSKEGSIYSTSNEKVGAVEREAR